MSEQKRPQGNEWIGLWIKTRFMIAEVTGICPSAKALWTSAHSGLTFEREVLEWR